MQHWIIHSDEGKKSKSNCTLQYILPPVCNDVVDWLIDVTWRPCAYTVQGSTAPHLVDDVENIRIQKMFA